MLCGDDIGLALRLSGHPVATLIRGSLTILSGSLIVHTAQGRGDGIQTTYLVTMEGDTLMAIVHRADTAMTVKINGDRLETLDIDMLHRSFQLEEPKV